MGEQPRERVICEYWSDPLCVWALVSQPRLDRLVAEGGDCLELRYRTVSVFGSVPWRFSDGPWAKEGPAGRAAATREIGARFGLELSGQVWVDDPPASSWSPGAAVEAVFGMEQRGECPANTGARYLRALRETFFRENRNVARRSAQLELAEALSIPRDSLTQALDDGSALAALWERQREKELRNIQGSPTYVFDDGRAVLYGNFAEGILHATLSELRKGLHGGCSAC